jgi:hypothetical protein
LFFSETAAEDHVVTFDRIAYLIDLCPEQPDVAHIVLGARIRTTGQMNVNRLIEMQFLFQVARQKNSMAFCVCGRPLASGIPGARDESAGDCARRMVKTHLDQILFHGLDEMVRHIGNDEILPDGQANLPGAVILCDVGDAAHLLRCHPADGNDRADIVKARLNLSERSDVSVVDRRRARLALVQRETRQRKGEFLFDFLNVLGNTPPIDDVFKSRPLAIGSIAVLDKNADDRGGDCNALIGCYDNS